MRLFPQSPLLDEARRPLPLSTQFDISIRMFVKSNNYCPRECLVLARIGFTKERAGHGRALVQRLVELAPQFGYRYLAIESANANASTFAERLDFRVLTLEHPLSLTSLEMESWCAVADSTMEQAAP